MLDTLTRPIRAAAREVGRDLASGSWPGQRSLTELIAVLHVATAAVEENAAELNRAGVAADLLAVRLGAAQRLEGSVQRLEESIDQLTAAVERLCTRLETVDQRVAAAPQMARPAHLSGPGADRFFGLRRHRDEDPEGQASPAGGNGATGA